MSKNNNISASIESSTFPSHPGVYLMKDQNERIIYVGKAKNLKNRIRQYLNQTDKRYQIQFLMDRTQKIDFLVTSNEKEALLLENSLIKKHKPKYNVHLKDDKTYLGLKITIKDDFPRLIETRKIKKDGAIYYGPFTSAESLREIKEFIYHYFQLRTCSDYEFSHRTRPCLEYQIKRCSAPCVNYVSKEEYLEQIKQVRYFLEGKNKSLQKTVQQKMLQASEKEKFEQAAIFRDLLMHMDSVLEKQNVTQLSFDFVDIIAFERFDDYVGIAVLMIREASLIDSKYFVLSSLEEDGHCLSNFLTQYYSENSFIPSEILLPFELEDIETISSLLNERAGKKIKLRKPKRGEKKDLLELAKNNLKVQFQKKKEKIQSIQDTLSNLQKKLHLLQFPERIECFDNSHHSGSQAVAGMVRFLEGVPDKSAYRKFKIQNVNPQDDFAMMYETLKRRFAKKDSDWQKPNLLLVDGGKGQLSQAIKVLEELNITGVEIACIAKGTGQGARAKGLWSDKKEEEVYIPNRKNPVSLKRGSAELMLLQNVRDEAHRFAISFHRQLKEKTVTQSVLDKIPGIGPKKKQILLKTFGSIEAIQTASPEEIVKKTGFSEKLAILIKAYTCNTR